MPFSNFSRTTFKGYPLSDGYQDIMEFVSYFATLMPNSWDLALSKDCVANFLSWAPVPKSTLRQD